MYPIGQAAAGRVCSEVSLFRKCGGSGRRGCRQRAGRWGGSFRSWAASRKRGGYCGWAGAEFRRPAAGLGLDEADGETTQARDVLGTMRDRRRVIWNKCSSIVLGQVQCGRCVGAHQYAIPRADERVAVLPIPGKIAHRLRRVRRSEATPHLAGFR